MTALPSNRSVAVVTGAAGELGRAICQRLHKDGLHIVAVVINFSAIEALAQSLSLSSDQRVVAINA